MEDEDTAPSSPMHEDLTSTPAIKEESDSQDGIEGNEEGVEEVEDSSGNEDEDEDDEEDDDDGDDDDDDDDEEDDEEDDEDEGDDDAAEDEESQGEDADGDQKPIVPALTLKRAQLSAGVASSPSGSDASGSTPAPKKRGRPSKAEMERRAKEKAEREARGEYDEVRHFNHTCFHCISDFSRYFCFQKQISRKLEVHERSIFQEPKPKRRGRKPMDPALKEKLRKERMSEKARMKFEKKSARDAKKAAIAERRRERMARKQKEEKEANARRKPGRKGRLLTDEEKEEREAIRKAKYEEVKRVKAEKAEKRRQRNEALKENRRKKKEEEARQREAYEKRMQELKASLLDESTQMSTAAAEQELEALMDETSQSSLTTRTNLEMSALDPIKNVTAETLFEYKWPLEGRNSEYYFLQEQVSEYLGVKSFKRRYPDVARRKINHDERDFLIEMRACSETQVSFVSNFSFRLL